MAMDANAAALILQRELPTIGDAVAKKYVTALRKMMSEWDTSETFGGTDVMVDKILKAAPLAVPPGLCLVGNENALRRHVLTLIEEIIPAADQFTWDWNTFGWDQLRASIDAAHKAAKNKSKPSGGQQGQSLPAPASSGTPAPSPGLVGGMAGKKYAWAEERPRGFGFVDVVPDCLLENADDSGLVGKVVVAGKEYKVKPMEGADDGSDEKHEAEKAVGSSLKGSVSEAAAALGLRTSSVFSAGYERCAKKFIQDVFTSHDSVESFVTMHFGHLKMHDRPGLRVKYRELMNSARTCDLTLKSCASRKMTQKQLWEDDVLELHAGSIAREDYVQRTQNYEGADAISGSGEYLLPKKAIETAALFAINNSKLRSSLRNSTSGADKGAKSGQKGGNNFVAIEDRVCYECGERGHLGRDCPKRKQRKGEGKGLDGQKAEKKKD